jgi:polygalacturonase
MKSRHRLAHTPLAALALLCLGAALPSCSPKAITTAQPVGETAAQALSVSHRAFFNVRDHGARGDGKTLDSPAINRAIEAAAQAGGGTVHLPAGIYLSGSIRLKSNIHLFIDAGAVILGAPQEMNAYDPPEPFEGTAYQDSGHTYFHNSLIWGEGLTNVSITGKGMIHGGGLTKDDTGVNRGPIRMGDKAIALKLCRDVLLRDITIFHGGHFAVLATGCDNLTIDAVTIDTNRDGINIDACRNVTVSNCRVNAPNDDAICPKSSFALGRNVITENMTITNCQVSGFEEGTLLDGTMKPSKLKNGRIKLGTESNGGFRNITITNCTFRQCRGLALEAVDGGVMENISISNITMMDVPHYPIYITTGKRNRGPGASAATSVARNISIANVIATGVDTMSGIQITGVPGRPIDGVRLENIRLVFQGGGTKKDAAREFPELGTGYPEPSNLGVTPSYGIFARHVRGLELADINLSVEKEDQRPPIVAIDVDGLEIDNFKAPVAPGVPAARFEGAKGVVIRSSPLLEARAFASDRHHRAIHLTGAL